VHAGVYVCANCSVTPPTWFFGHASMMSPDSTWNYKNITLYLTQNQQVCKELWDFQAACTGWRYTISFLGLNFVCTDPNFDCKVFWVGFHIYNYILNNFMKGCKTIPMKPIWNMGSNIFGKCRACGCVCLCQLFCYSTNLIFWACFNDVTWFYMKLQEHHTLSHSKPTSVQGVMGLSSCMHRVTLHSIFPGP
jgi:hypothetical protein